MGLTVFLGLAAAVSWGAPDLWLAQAVRTVGPLAVLFGSLLIGTVLLLLAAPFVETPAWSATGVLLAVGVGVLSAVAYCTGFAAFREGAVAVVAPIIACEGGVAAMFAIAGGEHLTAIVAAFLPVAVLGVVLAAMGRGGGKAAVVPAATAAILWGAILVLSAEVADDLGVYWGFVLIRVSALLATLPFAVRSGAWRGWIPDRWRVAAWGVGDTAAYLLFVAAADRGPVSVAGVLAAQFATIAVLVGTVFGGERLLRRQVVGVVLVIAAVSAIASTGT